MTEDQYAAALATLAEAGIGEGDFEDDCPVVDPDLTDLWIELDHQGKTSADLAAWVEAVGS